jgi:hypothetical protein
MTTYTISVRRRDDGSYGLDITTAGGVTIAKNINIPDRLNIRDSDAPPGHCAIALDVKRLIEEGPDIFAIRMNGIPGGHDRA